MASSDISCEPMDVDLSIHSHNDSNTVQPLTSKSPMLNESVDDGEVSRVHHTLKETKSSTFKPEVWNVKKYHILRKTEQDRNYSLYLLFVAILVIPLAVILYCISDIRCSNDIDLKVLKMKLANRLYGQPVAVEKLIEALDRDEKSKILFFYGGTGVGKTFTSTLIFDNIWNSSNVYHYTMPSFGHSFSTESMLGLNICDSSFVVVDDLKQNDLQVKEHIAEIIKKSEDLNRKITVILIFNCDIIAKDFVKKCDNTFYTELSQAYEDVKVYKQFIEFKPLTQEVLRMCIEDELRHKSVSDLHFNYLLNNFNVALDGCKGVYKKIKFLNVL